MYRGKVIFFIKKADAFFIIGIIINRIIFSRHLFFRLLGGLFFNNGGLAYIFFFQHGHELFDMRFGFLFLFVIRSYLDKSPPFNKRFFETAAVFITFCQKILRIGPHWL